MKFKTHDEIPEMLQNYLKTVAEVKEISMLPLRDINEFLQGINEYHHDRLAR